MRRSLTAAMVAAIPALSGGYAATADESERIVAIEALDRTGRPVQQGSGFFLNREIIVTACHVVHVNGFAREIAVTGPITDNTRTGRIEGKLKAHDYQRDVCLLSVDRPPDWAPDKLLPVARGVRAGQPVTVLGAPGKKFVANTGDIRETTNLPPLRPESVVADASVRFGMSGGPWVTLDGQLVGISTSRTVDLVSRDLVAVAASATVVESLLSRVDMWRDRERCFDSRTVACLGRTVAQMAQQIVRPSERAKALRVAGNTLANVGDNTAARALFDAAVDAAGDMAVLEDRVTELADIAVEMALFRHTETARDLLRSAQTLAATIEEPILRGFAKFAVSAARRKMKENEFRRKFAHLAGSYYFAWPGTGSIHDAVMRVVALGKRLNFATGARLIGIGRYRLPFDRPIWTTEVRYKNSEGLVMDATEWITFDSKERADIAVVRAAQGFVRAALRTAKKIPIGSVQRSRAMAAIAVELATCSDKLGSALLLAEWDRALHRFADKTRYPKMSGLTEEFEETWRDPVSKIAVRLTEGGHIRQAVQAVRQVLDGTKAVPVLSAIVKAAEKRRRTAEELRQLGFPIPGKLTRSRWASMHCSFRRSDPTVPREPDGKLEDLIFDEPEHDASFYMTFPKEHRSEPNSTNPIERLHAEIN